MEFLFERLVDDWLYQGHIRLEAKRQNLDFSIITKQLKKEAQQLLLNHFKDNNQIKTLQTLNIFFPWNRLFEIGVGCTLE